MMDLTAILCEIERHLKNISVSLRVMEERNRDAYEHAANGRKLTNLYDFGDADLPVDGASDSSSS
jgi:hypothetical protein